MCNLRKLIVHRRKNYIFSLHTNHGKTGTRIIILQKVKVVQFCCNSHVPVNLKHQTVIPISLINLPAHPGIKSAKTWYSFPVLLV